MPESIPPIARRAVEADATAPDGSEIRLLVDQRHRAERASMVEVTLPAGQVSRPVWHPQRGRGVVRPGRRRPSLALPAHRRPDNGGPRRQ